ncbi:hypothetical protein LTS09_005420 [Friedmanniomyces endolithicus]|nr:hypothetical protein LTS09_005420 [Friedmanniomyces endolithicus]
MPTPKTAYVTGGASGIGLAVTTMLLARGIRVAVADVNLSGAQAVASKHPDLATAYELNVADWDSQLSVFESVVKAFDGRVDYVYPIAGIGEKMFLPNDPGLKNGFVKPNLEVLEVDLNGFLYTASLAIQQMRRQDKDGDGFRGKTLPIYTAAKHAIIGFVRSFGKYLPEEGVTLNAVCPNVVKTNISTSAFYDELDAKKLLTPMKSVIEAFERLLDGGESGECIEAGPHGNLVANQSKAPAPVTSTTSSLGSLGQRALVVAGEIAASGFEFVNAIVFAYGPKETLKHAVSTMGYIAPSSSAVVREQHEHDTPPGWRQVRHIGQGQCGTVFALVGTGMVLKIANGPAKTDVLWQDCLTHKLVEEVFAAIPLALRPDISIPQFRSWINPSTEPFWSDMPPKSPTGFSKGYALLSERIFPLPTPIRDALFNRYAPKELLGARQKAAALAEQKNQDCLVRVYLGRRINKERTVANFKLRNFELHVDEIEDLGLDADTFSSAMAQSLAVMHWGANIDAGDVEFVLGTAPMIKAVPTRQEILSMGPDGVKYPGKSLNFKAGSVGLWLLDFNECKEFDPTEDASWLEKAGDPREGLFLERPILPQTGGDVWIEWARQTALECFQDGLPRRHKGAVRGRVSEGCGLH